MFTMRCGILRCPYDGFLLTVDGPWQDRHMGSPKKRPTASSVTPATPEQEGDDNEREDDGVVIAPLFAQSSNPIEADRIKMLALRRKNARGVYDDVIMDGAVDRRDDSLFEYNPFESTKTDIAFVFGPGSYEATAFDARNAVIGMYEFTLDHRQVAGPKPTNVRPPGFEGPGDNGDGGGGDDDGDPDDDNDDPPQRVRSPVSDDDLAGELARARRGGDDSLTMFLLKKLLGSSSKNSAIDTADQAHKIAEQILGTRSRLGVDPTSQGMLDTMREQADKAVNQMREQMTDQRKDFEKREADLRRELENERRKRDALEDELKKNHREEISDKRRDFEAREKAINEEHRNTLKARDAEIEDLKKDKRDAVREAREDAKRERERLEEDLKDARDRARGLGSSKDDLDEKWRSRNREDLERERANYQKRLDQLENEVISLKNEKRAAIEATERSFEARCTRAETENLSLKEQVFKQRQEIMELEAQIPDDDEDDEPNRGSVPRPRNGGVEDEIGHAIDKMKIKSPFMREGAKALAVMATQGAKAFAQEAQRAQAPGVSAVVRQNPAHPPPRQPPQTVAAPSPSPAQPITRAQAPYIRPVSPSNANVPPPPPPHVAEEVEAPSAEPPQVQLVSSGRVLSAEGAEVYQPSEPESERRGELAAESEGASEGEEEGSEEGEEGDESDEQSAA